MNKDSRDKLEKLDLDTLEKVSGGGSGYGPDILPDYRTFGDNSPWLQDPVLEPLEHKKDNEGLLIKT